MCSSDVFLGFLAVIFPPLPVWVKCGICSADSIINIMLCVLGFVPGLLHAWYIIAKFPEEPHDYHNVPQDAEGGRVTYVFVQGDGRLQQQQQQQQRQPRQQAQPQYKQSSQQHHGDMNYGATNSNNSAEAGGSSQAGGRAPPTYAEAVQGDHKIQTHD